MGKVANKENKSSNDKSVEEIEKDLQLPSSSEEELSEESEEESGEELNGFSSDEDESESEEQEQKEQKQKQTKKVEGHSVNKTIISGVSDKSSKKQKRGIIYIGRIPHGFYEDEMRNYFSQFGDIINLKLSRNKKTGKSKHYGFVEFGSYEAAKAAAETMNNYLLFGHLLKCELIDQSNAHESLFNQQGKFKVIPWKKISKNKNDKPKSKEKWAKLINKYESKKLAKQNSLKEKGIDFDLASI